MENGKLGFPTTEIVVVGAGAAGLMAGIFAARQSPPSTVILLDSAKRVGAKILAAGGGRCNVTHFEVSPNDYAGSSHNAIRKVLSRFSVEETIHFFHKLGVELHKEETGKLFPVSNKARTVLEALLSETERSGAQLRHPRRVDNILKSQNGFVIQGDWGEMLAKKVILATGGKSLPTTGSDGQGYVIARSLGHSLTPRIFPSLAPLLLKDGHFIRTLSGLTLPTTLEVRTPAGKRLKAFTDSTLCTHFGLSGPCALNISRFWTDAHLDNPETTLWVNWLPGVTPEELDSRLQQLGPTSPLGWLRDRMPERLALALCMEAGIDPRIPGHRLDRIGRKALVAAVTTLELPVMGDKGFGVAEVTAGGIPLSEINLATMESRVCPGLYLCGEICDVDGRIGGFNFQWAWASGYVAGQAAAAGKTGKNK